VYLFLKYSSQSERADGKKFLPITAFDCRVRSLIEWKDTNENE